MAKLGKRLAVNTITGKPASRQLPYWNGMGMFISRPIRVTLVELAVTPVQLTWCAEVGEIQLFGEIFV